MFSVSLDQTPPRPVTQTFYGSLHQHKFFECSDTAVRLSVQDVSRLSCHGYWRHVQRPREDFPSYPLRYAVYDPSLFSHCQSRALRQLTLIFTLKINDSVGWSRVTPCLHSGFLHHAPQNPFPQPGLFCTAIKAPHGGVRWKIMRQQALLATCLFVIKHGVYQLALIPLPVSHSAKIYLNYFPCASVRSLGYDFLSFLMSPILIHFYYEYKFLYLRKQTFSASMTEEVSRKLLPLSKRCAGS